MVKEIYSHKMNDKNRDYFCCLFFSKSAKFQMEVPIEISFDSDKPKKRAPPARFAAMMKQREEKEQVDPPNPTKEVITNNSKYSVIFLIV